MPLAPFPGRFWPVVVVGLIGALIAPAQARQRAQPTLTPGRGELDTEPYTRWKTHRGKPEECVAVVRVRRPSGTLTYNALVVRCDGFLMVPQPVWDAVKERVPVEVLVSRAEGESSTGPFPVTGRNLLKPRNNDYHFVKVNEHHVRCLPVLASWNLVKATPLQLVWATPGADGVSLVTHRVAAVCDEVPTERTASTAGLSFAAGEQPAQVPDGTLVVDTESQAAVGMIVHGDAPTRFATTRFFGDLCADVALAPHREAALGKDPKTARVPVTGPMEKVAGKPTIYNNKDYRDNYRTSVVCTPDFYCDPYLVTIRDWQAFLDFRRDRPQPDGWDARNRNNSPTDHPNLPVEGAIAGEMQDFAAWRNKRLLTTVEWLLAAETSSLDWLNRLLAEEDAINAELGGAENLYHAAMAQRVEVALLQAAQISRKSVAGQALAQGAAIDVFLDDLLQEYAGTIRRIQQAHSPFLAHLLGQPQEVGARPEDKSDNGIFDVNLNAPEACLGWGKNYGFAPKPRPAGQDPFISTVSMIRTNGATKGPGIGAIRGTIAGTGIEDPIVWAALWKAQYGGKFQKETPGRSYYIEVDARAGLAFRCAW